MTEKLNIIERLKSKKDFFSKSFQKVANIVIDNGFNASSMTIDELAQQANVSVATINRFVHQCGYSGYSQFKIALHNLYNNLFEPVEKLNQQQLSNQNNDAIVQQCLDNSIYQLTQTRQQINDINIKNVIEMILNAQNIYVVGMGVSALHAAFLVNSLEPFLFKKIKEINGYCGVERAFRSISMLEQKDVIIAITIPRYSKNIVDLVVLAKQKQAKIIAITDNLTSPIIPLADAALLAPADHAILYASNVAIIALIESLAATLALRIDSSAELLKQQTQSQLPYFYHQIDKNS